MFNDPPDELVLEICRQTEPKLLNKWVRTSSRIRDICSGISNQYRAQAEDIVDPKIIYNFKPMTERQYNIFLRYHEYENNRTLALDEDPGVLFKWSLWTEAYVKQETYNKIIALIGDNKWKDIETLARVPTIYILPILYKNKCQELFRYSISIDIDFISTILGGYKVEDSVSADSYVKFKSLMEMLLGEAQIFALIPYILIYERLSEYYKEHLLEIFGYLDSVWDKLAERGKIEKNIWDEVNLWYDTETNV